MPNKYYQPGAERAAKVQDLFATIAPRYDLVNDLQSFGLHRYWKKRLVKMSGARQSDLVLDVCCGTGDIALEWAGRVDKVVGLDFSAPMLAIARERARQRLRRPLGWIQGDALKLPFPDNLFDAVCIGFGLRNLADFELGLRELYRVVRPGGRLLVLDFGKPPNRLLRRLYFGYLEWWVPLFGRLLCRDAASYQYISESLRHYPAQEGVAQSMQKLGCGQVRIRNFLGGTMSINYGEKPPAVAARPS